MRVGTGEQVVKRNPAGDQETLFLDNGSGVLGRALGFPLFSPKFLPFQVDRRSNRDSPLEFPQQALLLAVWSMAARGVRRRPRAYFVSPPIEVNIMKHVHYCRDCENNWECIGPRCEKYVVYLCPECFGALICLNCYDALDGNESSTLIEEKTNRSCRVIESRS
jgi:hypothetical protein